MTRMMKLTNWTAFGCIATAAIVGCQNNTSSKPAETAGVRSDVTDIRPMESTTPAYQPVAYQPACPCRRSAPYHRSRNSDNARDHRQQPRRQARRTLYSIAKTSYGDGKQWQKIASANPGVSPSTLKVGQTLVIP